MAIKNKDGSTYCFRKPNPIMNYQSLWPKDETVFFHNKFGQRYYSHDQIIEVEEEFFEEIEEVEEESIKIVETVAKTAMEIDPEIFEVWCLPATLISNSDPLYGSTYSRIKYSEKFKIEAKMYDQEDLYCQLITKQEIPEHSVVLPINGERRWWRVVNNEKYENTNFWIVTGQPSDFQPDFTG